MKALTNKFRILHTLGLLLLAVTIGHCQGYFEQEILALHHANTYLDEISLQEFESERNLEVAMLSYYNNSVERELILEDWMEVSFVESVEIELETEEWMTKPLQASLENELVVEEWMTVSFTESAEEELAVEDWMTEALLTI